MRVNVITKRLGKMAHNAPIVVDNAPETKGDAAALEAWGRKHVQGLNEADPAASLELVRVTVADTQPAPPSRRGRAIPLADADEIDDTSEE